MNRGPAESPPLPEAVAAPRFDLHTDGGRISYYANAPGASGRPLLLIHSINAAPSTYEVKPLFERYAPLRPVYSIELPGFGHSERSARRYTPALFADAIGALLERVVGQPADVLALSLSAEFAARAALQRPQGVASLVLVSPTGFFRRRLPPPWVGRLAHGVLGAPLWSRRLYNRLVTRDSIRYYLGRSFHGEPPAALVDYAYATAHQPGAHHAPLHFLSTLLFTRRAAESLYARLGELPVLAIADRDPYIGFELLEAFAAVRENWRFERLEPHLGLPHWERSEPTFAALEAFWDRCA